jgi:hypothetical protein
MKKMTLRVCFKQRDIFWQANETLIWYVGVLKRKKATFAGVKSV